MSGKLKTPGTLPSASIAAPSLTARLRSSLAIHPVFWLVAVFLILRCIFILISPLDLIADESYYWDWSRRLDYGYYSKPPMIAWINWISTSLLGSHEFAVRFPAALLGTLGLIWVYQLGAKLFSFRVGLCSMILLALTPGQTALSFLMTIDAPFLFCWVAALYSFWMMVSESRPTWQWCLLTALWLGLGILTKQTMLAFYPLTGLFLLVTPARRHLLWSSRLWLTAALSLMFLLPVIYWNYQHDWITLQHTASHFEDHSVTLQTRIARFAEFFAGQMGVVSPVLWVTVAVTLIAACRRFPSLTEGERYLFCFSGVPLAGIILLSLTRRLEPNWPAAFYPAGVILATAVLLGRSSLGNVFRNRDRQLAWSWRVGLASCLLTYAAITIVPASPLAGSPLDVTCRLRGWRELADQFEEIQKSATISSNREPLIISTAGRDITSALAFYLSEQPLVPFWSYRKSHINCQYDLWDRPEVREDQDVIVVTTPGSPLPLSLSRQRSVWEPVGDLNVDLGNDRQRQYQVYISRAVKTPAVPEKTALRPLSTPSQKTNLK